MDSEFSSADKVIVTLNKEDLFRHKYTESIFPDQFLCTYLHIYMERERETDSLKEAEWSSPSEGNVWILFL